MARSPSIPQELGIAQVLVRFLLRVTILGAFAAFGGQGFAKTFAMFLALAAVFCAVIATLRREPITWNTLTNWDEAAIYLLMSGLAASLA